ncbi:unnamed protein product, partial [Mesorhabditis spiculigera]
MSAGLLTVSTTIINNDSEFPSLGGRGTPGSFSLLPTTSGYSANQSPIPSGYGANNRPNYGTSATSEAVGPTEGRAEQRFAELTPEEASRTGIITRPDGEVTNIPPGMLNDQFGMAGFVTYWRMATEQQHLLSMAIGYDLTGLGLNISSNSDRLLYTTFGGPWADYPCRPQDMDARVPVEYLTNATIRDKLPNIRLHKLGEDVLFFLFYNCPGEVYQVAAAAELYTRDWRFHKQECIWLTRSQYGQIKEQTQTYENGSYMVFDPIQWRKVPREMKLEYKYLEERPKLPPSMQIGASGAAGAPAAPASAPSANGPAAAAIAQPMAPGSAPMSGASSPAGGQPVGKAPQN